MVARLGEVMWVVDLNRQSLDRVVPDIAAGRLAAMFEAAGWHTVMVKYGPLLRKRPDLRARIDAMPNEEYQRLLRADAAELRQRHRGRASTTSTTTTCWPPSATSAATTSPACSTATARPTRSSTARASSSPTRSRAGRCRRWAIPANHSALLNHAQYARAGGQARRGPGRSLQAARPRLARGASCARRPGSGSSAAPRARSPRRRSRATSAASTPARPPPSRRSAASSSTSCARRRTWPQRVVTVSPDVGTSHQPRRLDQQGGDLERRRPDRLVRRRHRHAGALARVRPRPPHRARHRRGQPRRPARGARRDLVARRPAAAAGRDDLRPVRVTRAGALVVRDLRGRPVDPRRHAVRRHARPRGRRAPVGDHAVASASSSPAASPTSPPSARTSSGASCTRSPSSASPAGRAPTSGSRRARSTSRTTPARARRRSPAATSCGRTTRPTS